MDAGDLAVSANAALGIVHARPALAAEASGPIVKLAIIGHIRSGKARQYSVLQQCVWTRVEVRKELI